MEKLEYLNKYTLDVNKKVELLTNIEVGDMKEGLIPNEWKIIFQKDNKQEKIISVLQMWSKYVGKELSNTIAYLKDNLIDKNFHITPKDDDLYSMVRLEDINKYKKITN